MLKFTSPIPPSSNEYLGKRVSYAGGKPYVQVYKTKKAMDYERYMVKTLNRSSKEQEWVVPEKNEYVEMELVYYMNKLGRDIDNTYKLSWRPAHLRRSWRCVRRTVRLHCGFCYQVASLNRHISAHIFLSPPESPARFAVLP